MTSIDTVLRSFQATRQPVDDLLSQIVCFTDIDDTIAIPMTLLLVDGSTVRGTAASDMTMAKACDEPLRQRLEETRNRPGLTPEQTEMMNHAMPSLAGRGLGYWLQDLHDRRAAAEKRASNDGEPLEWTDLSEPDVMILATFLNRSAISLRDASVERRGEQRPKRIPLMRVQLSAVTAWWIGHDE